MSFIICPSIDGCADGNSGSFHSDESNDGIVVRASESGAALEVGGGITITATVFVWSATEDTANFFYSTDASSPVWNYIGSAQPSGTGLQDISMTYTIPMGTENQAVRVQFGYQIGASSNPCESGDYHDTDDLVFKVVIPSLTLIPSPEPSPAPTSAPSNVRLPCSFSP